MDNNDHTPHTNSTPSTGGVDTGPEVRRMSPHIRDHARGTLLAETSLVTASGAESLAAADGVSFGRDGVDDAPNPLKKRWMVIASGLAVAAAGAAIIAGYGVLSGDDLGTGPAGTDQSQDADADGPDGISDLSVVQARTACKSQMGVDESAVIYEHHTPAYSMLTATDGGITQMCATIGGGQGTFSSEVANRANPVTEFLRQTFIEDDQYNETLGGKVTDDVTKVEILSAGEPVATAHLEDTWFSASATTKAGDPLSYRVTMTNGDTRDVVVDDPMYEDPRQLRDRMDENMQMLAEGCFSDIEITLSSTPTEGDPESQRSEGDYVLTGTHEDPSYLVSFAENGTAVSVCATTYGERIWGGTQPLSLPPGAPIARFEMSPAPTDKGPHPVIGQAASNVTSVDVVRADGKRRETVLENGFYSLMLPATDAEGLTYVVYTDDGESTTIGSD